MESKSVRCCFKKLGRNCSRRRQLCTSFDAHCPVGHFIRAQFPNPISSVQYVPQDSIPVYPTRSGVLCTGICIRTERKNMYGHFSIFTFRWVVPQANSVGSHFRRLHGNIRHGQNKTDRPRCLWASTSLRFLHAPAKAKRRVRRFVRYPLVIVLPTLAIHAQANTTQSHTYDNHEH